MNRRVQIGAVIVAVVGAILALGGSVTVGFGVLGEKLPPPSLNEGHGLAFVLGIATIVVGLLVLWTGLAIRAGFTRKIRNASGDPEGS
jgi:protein-S-isoprenylcysteine O-methyltransferase Ste14